MGYNTPSIIWHHTYYLLQKDIWKLLRESSFIRNLAKQAEAEVAPSSSLVEVEVWVEVGVEVGVEVWVEVEEQFEAEVGVEVKIRAQNYFLG